MPSETPKTDSATFTVRVQDDVLEVTHAYVARQLERKLAAAKETERKFGTMMHARMEELDTARAQLAEAKKDAERYRHLRNHCTSQQAAALVTNTRGSAMDARIDAAIRARGERT
jgi:hypothetical protein